MLQLHFGNGFNYEEIGQILKVSSEAVRKRVARGVDKFRALYGQAPAVDTPAAEAQLIASQESARLGAQFIAPGEVVPKRDGR